MSALVSRATPRGSGEGERGNGSAVVVAGEVMVTSRPNLVGHGSPTYRGFFPGPGSSWEEGEGRRRACPSGRDVSEYRARDGRLKTRWKRPQTLKRPPRPRVVSLLSYMSMSEKEAL